MNNKGQWTVPASQGACNALRDHCRLITVEVLAEAERLALNRSKLDGYEAAITRQDVEQACGIQQGASSD